MDLGSALSCVIQVLGVDLHAVRVMTTCVRRTDGRVYICNTRLWTRDGATACLAREDVIPGESFASFCPNCDFDNVVLGLALDPQEAAAHMSRAVNNGEWVRYVNAVVRFTRS